MEQHLRPKRVKTPFGNLTVVIEHPPIENNPLEAVWQAFRNIYPDHPPIEIIYDYDLEIPEPPPGYDDEDGLVFVEVDPLQPDKPYCDEHFDRNEKNQGWGWCSHPTPEMSDPKTVVIGLSLHLGMGGLVEVFAHELAHAVTPEDDRHGEQWYEAFMRIHAEYTRVVEERIAARGGSSQLIQGGKPVSEEIPASVHVTYDKDLDLVEEIP